MYGKKQMRRILEAKESIIFKRASLKENGDDSVETPLELQPTKSEATQQILASLLAHIAGDKVSKRSLSKYTFLVLLRKRVLMHNAHKIKKIALSFLFVIEKDTIKRDKICTYC